MEAFHLSGCFFLGLRVNDRGPPHLILPKLVLISGHQLGHADHLCCKSLTKVKSHCARGDSCFVLILLLHLSCCHQESMCVATHILYVKSQLIASTHILAILSIVAPWQELSLLIKKVHLLSTIFAISKELSSYSQ